jgi:hypothetical protein
MKKIAVLTLILICLITSGAVYVQPIKAEYQGNITINADGNISPSTAPIQQAGNTYVLTSDLNGSISVERNNSILDGNGLTITGTLSIGYNNAPSYSPPNAGSSYTSNVTIENFVIKGSAPESVYGIQLIATSKAVIANNTITGTGNGILSMDEPTAAIDVEGGGSNIITGNNLVNNYDGMRFLETNSNLIVGNNITNSSNPTIGDGTGIAFWGASNNTIYHNNFVSNPVQAYDDSFNSPFSVNSWDDGYPSGGNYWSDYSARYPSAKQIGSSGIGDTAYVIDAQNKDRYPLMEPFTGAFYALQTAPPKISVQSPLNQTYNDPSIPLTFSVDVLSPDKTVNWTGYSLDGEPNVTVAGSGALTNVTIANVANGVHSITVYANDSYGNMGASETVTFTVAKPEPFPTALVATASGASAAVACLGLLLYFKKRKR